MQFDNKVLLLLSFLFLCDFTNADYFPECDNFPAKSIIQSSKGCNFYIFCDDMESFDGNCGEGLYFNAVERLCDIDNVNCNFKEEDNEIASTTTTTRPRPTTTTTIRSTTITPPLLAQFNFSAIQSTPRPPLQPTTFTELSSNMESTTATPNTVTASEFLSSQTPRPTQSTPIAMVTECPSIDNPNQMSFISHAKSCGDYFICYHGKAIAMHCSAMLHFNTRTGKCDYPENARCQTVNADVKEQCRPHTIDLYPHSSNCNYFYLCRNGFLLLQQCPIFFGWDHERRNCIPRNQSKCYTPTNQQSNNIFAI